MKPLNVLISHSHAERPLAEALSELLGAVSSGLISGWYSSDTSAIGGMTLGVEWRETLREKISDSDLVIAILSSASRDRPWILWECGVMNGLAQAQAAAGRRSAAAVIPVIYSMTSEDLRNPLSSFQLYPGDKREKVSEICERLAKEAGIPAPRPELWDLPLDRYMSAVAAHSPRRARTMDDMMLWRTRFEQAIRSGRSNEVVGLRQLMYTAFGTGFRPISMQLHDLLSAVMLETRHFPEALQEADYGLSLDSNDTTLLHRKALVLAEQQDFNAALEAAKQLIATEPTLATNTEIAGLLGRVYRDRFRNSNDFKDLNAARKAYQDGAEANRSDYYCALNAAELALAAGDKSGAEPLLNQALSNAREAQQASISSFWADFTVGQVLLGKADFDAALAEYEHGLKRDPAPEPRNLQSALKGAARMAELTGAPANIRERLSGLLS